MMNFGKGKSTRLLNTAAAPWSRRCQTATCWKPDQFIKEVFANTFPILSLFVHYWLVLGKGHWIKQVSGCHHDASHNRFVILSANTVTRGEVTQDGFNPWLWWQSQLHFADGTFRVWLEGIRPKWCVPLNHMPAISLICSIMVNPRPLSFQVLAWGLYQVFVHSPCLHKIWKR